MRLLSPLQGTDYVEVLANFHKLLRPSSYFEIGTQNGGTLKLAKCASVAVDPRFQIVDDIYEGKPSLMLFQQASDRFFGEADLETLFGRRVDLAFLDGLHLFEFLLRDFINTENYCRRNSVVILHDCLPCDAHVARRDMLDMSRQSESEHPDWWAGDVWKMISILREHRPDLTVTIYDAPPTGLVFITGLNPASTILSDRYYEILRQWQDCDDEAELRLCIDQVTLVSTNLLMNFNNVRGRFWL